MHSRVTDAPTHESLMLGHLFWPILTSILLYSWFFLLYEARMCSALALNSNGVVSYCSSCIEDALIK